MQKAARAVLLLTPVFLILFCIFPSEPGRVSRDPVSPPGGTKFIRGGTFMMGTDTARFTNDVSAQPAHQVTVSDFFMDSTEVTQLEYYNLQLYYYGILSNPAHWANLTNPVESVSWFDAVLFANARSKRDNFDTVYSYSAVFRRKTESGVSCSAITNLSYNLKVKGYRLPTEAEREYACRAGTTTDYYWGETQEGGSAINTVDTFAWMTYNSPRRPSAVALKWPNAFGLYDMIGNVKEWCHDWYKEGYDPAPAFNPVGPDSGCTERAIRGGAFTDNPTTGDLDRSATRQKAPPDFTTFTTGFRLVIPK